MSQQQNQNDSNQRGINIQFDLKVPADTVWKALTDGEELSRWFAPDVKVAPGVGGLIIRRWDATLKDEWPITIWEPNKHLRILHPNINRPGAAQIAVDYFIEDLGGGATRLRLVSYGFSKDASWDDLYDGVTRGWDVLLWELREYIEKHLGKPRAVHTLRCAVTMPFDEIWQRLCAREGLFGGDLLRAKAGDRFTLLAGAESFAGVIIKICSTQYYLQAIVQDLNDAVLRIDCYPSKGGATTVSFSLNTFECEPARLEKIERSLMTRLESLLGSKVEIERVD